MELFFSLRCTDVPLTRKLWIWCTSVWNHRQVFFFPSAKVQASQAHSQPIDVTCSHRITEQAERALHIFAQSVFFMFFPCFCRCKQYWMQKRSANGLPVPGSSTAFCRPAPGCQCWANITPRLERCRKLSIRRHQLIKYHLILTDLNWDPLTRFCTVSYWRRSQWSFYPLQCRELRPWWWLAAPALTIRQHAVTEWNDSNRKMGNTAQSKTSCTPSFCTGYVNAFVYYCHALVAIYSDCC